MSSINRVVISGVIYTGLSPYPSPAPLYPKGVPKVPSNPKNCVTPCVPNLSCIASSGVNGGGGSLGPAPGKIYSPSSSLSCSSNKPSSLIKYP